jgi:hypothetical protein
VYSGFCRQEIQKVLKKHVGEPSSPKNITAKDALWVFAILGPQFSLSPFANKTQKYPRLEEWFGKALLRLSYRFPVFVGELMVALDTSVRRIGEMPKNNPERIIETSAKDLVSVKVKRKLAEALPRLNENELSQVRQRLSSSRRVVSLWKRALITEMCDEVTKSERMDLDPEEYELMCFLLWIPLPIIYQKNLKSRGGSAEKEAKKLGSS